MAWSLLAGTPLGIRSDDFGITIPKISGEISFERGEGPGRLTLETIGGDGVVTLEGRRGGLSVSVGLTVGERVSVEGHLEWQGPGDLVVDTVTLDLGAVVFDGMSHPVAFKHGYQSWTQTRSFQPGARDMTPRLRFAQVMQEDMRSLPDGRPGMITSEMLTMVGDLESRRYLLVGQTAPYRHGVHLLSTLEEGAPAIPLTITIDLGGVTVRPGTRVPLDPVLLMAGDHANRLLDEYLEAVAVDGVARDELPVGWCSWYYYYTRVGIEDVQENLRVARDKKVRWYVFQLDDGYQRAVGDWLDLNGKFPRPMAELTGAIEDSGMVPGLWLAPFMARANARVVEEHTEWFLRDRKGGLVRAGWNPLWGIGGTVYALDTTHPGFKDHLRRVIGTMVREWGFKYLKLDFLYSACLDGAAFDPTKTPAERLQIGYDVVREAAGDDVFILGCGAPMAPSIGKVDGMRIGPDVAPYWFPTYRYHLTRDPHALSAAFAIRNMLTRAQLHKRLWLNDPDCLLVRDTETKLTADERETLTTAIVITGGMFLVSDRLSRLPEAFWSRLDEVQRHAQACHGGTCWPLDLMERELPELVYNSAGYLAVFNFDKAPKRVVVPWAPHLEGLVPRGATLRSVWDDRPVTVTAEHIDLGTLPAHGSCLLELAKETS